jgi:hypothetical protein
MQRFRTYTIHGCPSHHGSSKGENTKYETVMQPLDCSCVLQSMLLHCCICNVVAIISMHSSTECAHSILFAKLLSPQRGAAPVFAVLRLAAVAAEIDAEASFDVHLLVIVASL